ncbi:MAG: hypothetical protein K2M91_06800 [Lachnospiraceae bacterium]|nr:hypothetical protein [Lachnospiraceae bacterium]
MKKLLLPILLGGIFFLSSCGNESPSVNELETPEIERVFDVENAFLSVLLNEETFVYNDNTLYDFYDSINGYLGEIPFNDNTMKFSQFTIVDLDGDSMPEIVLAIEEYMGFIILKYTEDGVRGNCIGYRSMIGLKEDGSSYSTASSSEHWIGKKYFVGDTVLNSDKLYVNGSAYYIHDMAVGMEEADTLEEAFNNAAEVKWYDFSEKSIEQHIKGNMLFSDVSQNKAERMSERQRYMDLMQYVIDLARNYAEPDIEKRNVYAKKYYESCKNEMNKIYGMCSKECDDLDIHKMQQDWEAGFDNRLLEALKEYGVHSIEELEDWGIYFTYGDMMLRRTLQLVSIYYGCDFYD